MDGKSVVSYGVETDDGGLHIYNSVSHFMFLNLIGMNVLSSRINMDTLNKSNQSFFRLPSMNLFNPMQL